jgi:hypothetical protein
VTVDDVVIIVLFAAILVACLVSFLARKRDRR